MGVSKKVGFLAVATLCLLSGCQRNSSSSDMFQLSVEDVLHDDTMDVVVLTVHAPGIGHAVTRPTAELEVELTHYCGSDGVSFCPDADGNVGDAKITATGCLTAPAQNRYSYRQTIFHCDYNYGGVHSYGGGPFIEAIERGAKLKDSYAITVTPGTYKIGTPLVIGTLDGKPVTLEVKKLPAPASAGTH